MTVEYVNFNDVQGNILRGYAMTCVRHLVVTVADAREARKFLASVVSGSDQIPQLRTAQEWADKPEACLNVAVSATGLEALGLPKQELNTFPGEFRAGAPSRATKVGDIGLSSPENWADGMGRPENAHLMWSIHASSERARDHMTKVIDALWAESGAFKITSRLDGQSLPDDDDHVHVDGDKHLLGDKVHFGYRDSIAQPRFEVNDTHVGRKDAQPTMPIGSILLGYDETSFPDVSWQIPLPIELGKNGCFNAFRVLEQDVHAFEDFLERSGTEQDWNKELVAAKLMGRWRNGVALATTHEEDFRKPGAGMPPTTSEEELNDFDYPDSAQGVDDLEGRPCPIGAHIRRANPRGSRIVQRSANYTRPIIRRGIPYGPPYDPSHPDDGHKRGLLGNFMCASLIAQFEAIMYDWINLGLLDPRITGTNDPIIGANDQRTSRFEIRMNKDETVVLKGFPRFTHTTAGIYLFCPSITAVRYLSNLHG